MLSGRNEVGFERRRERDHLEYRTRLVGRCDGDVIPSRHRVLPARGARSDGKWGQLASAQDLAGQRALMQDDASAVRGVLLGGRGQFALGDVLNAAGRW